MNKIGLFRAAMMEFPTWFYYRLFWWLYPTKILRLKAAGCPYDRTRLLLLKQSGVVIGPDACVNYGAVVLGIARKPPAVTLGARCAIGPYVSFITSSYPDYSHLLKHPEVAPLIKRLAPITVGDDAWIGAGVIIFPGVAIGKSAIVGAGAIVREDVPANAVVAGSPARILRYLNPVSDSPCN